MAQRWRLAKERTLTRPTSRQAWRSMRRVECDRSKCAKRAAITRQVETDSGYKLVRRCLDHI